MTVKIDGVDPNIFPDVEDLDARDAGRNVEVFLDIRVEGKPTPVTVKLSYEQASRSGHSSGAFPKALASPLPSEPGLVFCHSSSSPGSFSRHA